MELAKGKQNMRDNSINIEMELKSNPCHDEPQGNIN